MYIIISTESILIAQGKCLGGVGAIMWACRARDSGSNPGIRARSSVWQSAWLLTKRPRVQFPSGPL